jgi:hypothetical protein
VSHGPSPRRAGTARAAGAIGPYVAGLFLEGGKVAKDLTVVSNSCGRGASA